MSWLREVSNPDSVLAVYGDAGVPDLVDVSVHEVALHRDGPSLRIRLDLREYPAVPPAKWSERKHNTVQVVLLAVGLRSLELHGMSTLMVGSVGVAKTRDGVSLVFDGHDGVRLMCEADSLRVDSIAGYSNAP